MATGLDISPVSSHRTGKTRKTGEMEGGREEEEREGLGHLTTICPVIHLLTGLSPCTLLYVTSVSVITVYEWTEPVGPGYTTDTWVYHRDLEGRRTVGVEFRLR